MLKKSQSSVCSHSFAFLVTTVVLIIPASLRATPDGGQGNEFVRSHRFSIMGANVQSAMFNVEEFLGAGMTTLLAYAETTPQVRDASQAGVPWVILVQPADSGMDDYFRGLVTSAASYSGCEGWIVFDEPSRLQMPGAKNAADWIRTISPNTLIYAVALPSYASTSQLYGDASNPAYSWTTYLDDFVSIIQPEILMYDDYPFLADGSTRNTFLGGVMEVRAKGIESNLPYFSFLQSWAYPGWRLPSESDLRMQAFTYLAAGYSGLAYFTYDQYNHDGGLIDSDGNHTSLYPIAVKLNAEILNLGKSLRFLTSTGVRYLPGKHGLIGLNNPIPEGMYAWSSGAGGNPHITDVGVDASQAADRGEEKNGLIGFFMDDTGHHYFMLVNLSHGAGLDSADESLPIWVQFDDTVDRLLELDRETGLTRTISLTDHRLYVTLLGGSGRLYKFDDGPFAPDRPLTILSVEATDITETSAHIHFVFNQHAQGQVEYGVDSRYGSWSIKEESFNYSSHTQLLTNLRPGTTYHYRVHGWDHGGSEVVSDDMQFTTLNHIPEADSDYNRENITKADSQDYTEAVTQADSDYNRENITKADSQDYTEAVTQADSDNDRENITKADSEKANWDTGQENREDANSLSTNEGCGCRYGSHSGLSPAWLLLVCCFLLLARHRRVNI